MTRKPWAEYFLDMAESVATRGTCPRLQVGAVLVWKNRIMATGYNGAYSGDPHCEDVGCDLDPCDVHGSHCRRARHAEGNIIDQLDLMDDLTAWAILPHEYLEMTLYVTHEPCQACRNELNASNITNLVWRHPYKFAYGDEGCSLLGGF